MCCQNLDCQFQEAPSHIVEQELGQTKTSSSVVPQSFNPAEQHECAITKSETSQKCQLLLINVNVNDE